MCSVIEIKNANEYYIHYHSPESLPNAPAKNSKSMEEQENTKLKLNKDQEVTSDRGSSASPSLEDEEEQNDHKKDKQNEQNEQKKSPSPAKESKIPVRSKKLAPQPPPKPNNNNKKAVSKKSSAPKPPLDSKNPFLMNETETIETHKNSETHTKSNKKKKSSLPRPSPSKLTPARSLESVPITVNSHIPASPLRPSSVALKKVTSEMGTQVEKVTKSVSVENLASPGNRKSNAKSAESLKTSESSDPLCQGKKWSYTNGRP